MVFVNPIYCQDKMTDLKIIEEINDEMIKLKIPSIVTCIIKEDSIVWNKSFGYANLENKVPATENTHYLLASVSKLVTAVAVMQLHEKGKINIDDDINKYLPFSVKNPKYSDTPITPRMLLTHRSGLAWPNEEDPDFYRPTLSPITIWVFIHLRQKTLRLAAEMNGKVNHGEARKGEAGLAYTL